MEKTTKTYGNKDDLLSLLDTLGTKSYILIGEWKIITNIITSYDALRLFSDNSWIRVWFHIHYLWWCHPHNLPFLFESSHNGWCVGSNTPHVVISPRKPPFFMNFIFRFWWVLVGWKLGLDFLVCVYRIDKWVKIFVVDIY